MAGMQLSDKGIQELFDSEGSRLKAYQDQKGIWTIGYGHTGKVNGVPIHKGMTITPEQQKELFLEDKARFEKAVNDNVKVPLSQNGFDALVNLSYNIGDGAFKNSTLLKHLNNGNRELAAEQFLVWNKTDKKFNQGLMNRRLREKALFLNESEGSHLYQAPPQQQQNYLQPTETVQPTQELVKSFFPSAQTETNFNQLNATLNPLAPMEMEQPKVNNRVKYQKQLAKAFGIEPQVNDGLPDYIGDLVRSIYDQTT